MALGVSASYDALIDLFDCIANFLKRLNIYTEMTRLAHVMSDILVKIIVEILSVLALATKQINQGRLSMWRTVRSSSFQVRVTKRNIEKFAMKLIGECDIEAILQRLDRLTHEEARVTAAHTLEVVHELFDNLKIVMEGEEMLVWRSSNN